jgi:hypothetical protein
MNRKFDSKKTLSISRFCLVIGGTILACNQTQASVLPAGSTYLFGARVENFDSDNSYALEQTLLGRTSASESAPFPTQSVGSSGANGTTDAGGKIQWANTGNNFTFSYNNTTKTIDFTVQNANGTFSLPDFSVASVPLLNQFTGFTIDMKGFDGSGANNIDISLSNLALDGNAIGGPLSTLGSLSTTFTSADLGALPNLMNTGGFNITGTLAFTFGGSTTLGSAVGKNPFFGIYVAAAPEASTMAFGGAMVGGLVLLEVRRRAKSKQAVI